VESIADVVIILLPGRGTGWVAGESSLLPKDFFTPVSRLKGQSHEIEQALVNMT